MNNGNTPIEQLMAQYEHDGVDHNNVQFLIGAAYRYVQTMEDCQVRCLLHAMAKKLENWYDTGDIEK